MAVVKTTVSLRTSAHTGVAIRIPLRKRHASAQYQTFRRTCSTPLSTLTKKTAEAVFFVVKLSAEWEECEQFGNEVSECAQHICKRQREAGECALNGFLSADRAFAVLEIVTVCLDRTCFKNAALAGAYLKPSLRARRLRRCLPCAEGVRFALGAGLANGASLIVILK